MEELNLLILGAGWTATFLIPLLQSRNISFAATTTTGHPVAGVPTLPFKFDPSAPEHETRSAIAALPRARHILITFPLIGAGPSRLLLSTYTETHLTSVSTAQPDDGTGPFRFIQLGSTGIWQQQQQRQQQQQQQKHQEAPTPTSPWLTRHSPYARDNPRAVAEDELLALGGCVLNLAGLWGGTRAPRRWARRVAPTKEALRGKASLHLVHGADVARALVRLVEGDAVGSLWDRAGRGQRWMVTDGFVYDWWALVVGWADSAAAEEEEEEEEEGEGEGEAEAEVGAEPTERARWVFELMREHGIRALPRPMETLGRCYDTREFWEAFGLVPLKGRMC
ncbi:hypothetical protein MYCTH_2308246 [Thermothelomyces thermophilus ATCC 42464]|uniref:NAD(P)-binding domain-containing protein n=1 Tax=Thermothelomyces thermophilus (strain ATCC 42464 / BCRC 31852 / DSM 1799) TaxID=573729 RepID=G2QJI2_THET4|nr:uncharacterized protein MYCTH_2308246 [Thermothelomyces thermophilus ATCC 42464]AEO59739.1 hypothetical protein MYCTH_2308246 [Thermothelomyces thermophilus ATCC 42464]